MAIRLNDNIFERVISLFQSKYPELDAEVQFMGGLSEQAGAWGVTEVSEDPNDPPIITIDILTPLGAVIELLSHELSHVVVVQCEGGEDEDHGPKWQAVFDWAFRRWCELEGVDPASVETIDAVEAPISIPVETLVKELGIRIEAWRRRRAGRAVTALKRLQNWASEWRPPDEE